MPSYTRKRPKPSISDEQIERGTKLAKVEAAIIEILTPLTPEERYAVLHAVCAIYGLDLLCLAGHDHA